MPGKEELQQKTQEQQEAFQRLTQESMEAYMGFFRDPLAAYQQSVEAARQGLESMPHLEADSMLPCVR